MSSRWPQGQQDQRPGHATHDDEAWSQDSEGAQPWQDAGWQDGGWGAPGGSSVAQVVAPPRASARTDDRGQRSPGRSPAQPASDHAAGQFDQEWNQSGGGFGEDEDLEWFSYLSGGRSAKPDGVSSPQPSGPGKSDRRGDRDRDRDRESTGRRGFRSRRGQDKAAPADPRDGQPEPAERGRGRNAPADRDHGRNAPAERGREQSREQAPEQSREQAPEQGREQAPEQGRDRGRNGLAERGRDRRAPDPHAWAPDPGFGQAADPGYSWPGAPSRQEPAGPGPGPAAPAADVGWPEAPVRPERSSQGYGQTAADPGFAWPAAASPQESTDPGRGHAAAGPAFAWAEAPSRPEQSDPGFGPSAADPGFAWPGAASPHESTDPDRGQADPGFGWSGALSRHEQSDPGHGPAAADAGFGRAKAAESDDGRAATDPGSGKPARGKRRHGRPDPDPVFGHLDTSGPQSPQAEYAGTGSAGTDSAGWPEAPGHAAAGQGFDPSGGAQYEAAGWPQAPAYPAETPEHTPWPGPPVPAGQHFSPAPVMSAPAFAEPEAPAWSDPSGWPGSPAAETMNAPAYAENAPAYAENAPAYAENAPAYAEPESPGWPEAPAWPESPGWSGPAGQPDQGFGAPGTAEDPPYAESGASGWGDAPGWPDTSGWAQPSGADAPDWPAAPGGTGDAPGWPVAAEPEYGAPTSTDPRLGQVASAAGPGGDRRQRPPARRGDRDGDSAGPGRSAKTREGRRRDGRRPGGDETATLLQPEQDARPAKKTAPGQQKRGGKPSKRPAGPPAGKKAPAKKAPAKKASSGKTKAPSKKAPAKKAPSQEGLRPQPPAPKQAAVKTAKPKSSGKTRPSGRVIAIAGASAAVVAGAAVFALTRSGGGVPHVITTPNQIDAYVQQPPLAQQMDVGSLEQQIVRESAGETKHVVSTVYEDSTGPAAASGPQIVLFLGGNLDGVSAGSFISTLTGNGAETTSPGSLGGAAACIPSMDGRLAECVWADDDTFGVVGSQTLSPSALANQMREMRLAVEHPTSTQQ